MERGREGERERKWNGQDSGSEQTSKVTTRNEASFNFSQATTNARLN